MTDEEKEETIKIKIISDVVGSCYELRELLNCGCDSKDCIWYNQKALPRPCIRNKSIFRDPEIVKKTTSDYNHFGRPTRHIAEER